MSDKFITLISLIGLFCNFGLAMYLLYLAIKNLLEYVLDLLTENDKNEENNNG